MLFESLSRVWAVFYHPLSGLGTYNRAVTAGRLGMFRNKVFKVLALIHQPGQRVNGKVNQEHIL